MTWSQVREERDSSVHTLVSDALQGPSLLRGPVRWVEMSELLATIPAKPMADKLIFRFFDPLGPAVPALRVFPLEAICRQLSRLIVIRCSAPAYIHATGQHPILWTQIIDGPLMKTAV